MTQYLTPLESLNDLRIELERVTFAETEAKEELSIFFEVLKILTDYKNEEILIAKLLEVFKRVLMFQSAFIVVGSDPENSLVTTFTTAPQFKGTIFSRSSLFKRVLGGSPIAVFDISESDEWRVQPESVRAGVRSALYLKVKDTDQGIVLICTHPDRGFFSWKDFDRSTQFAVFLSQALSNLSYTNSLREMNEKLQHEIQERSKAEELLEKQRLLILHSSKMTALGEMAGGIAHEINNPLAIIQNSSEQLSELVKSAEIDRAMVTRLTTMIVRTVVRIATIIGGLRSFSRDDSRDPFQTVSVRSMIDAVLALSSARLHEKKIELILEIPDEPLEIDCHPTQIEQVLLNLLVNAQDAISKKTDKWIRVSVESDLEYVRISVTDSGSGVQGPIATKIFDPFFTTKEIGKGTGLGLSISKGLVELHHGTLELDSTSPNTCFRVQLPRKISSI